MKGWKFGPLISGIGLCFSFPGFSFYPLAWFALVPYLRFLLVADSWRPVLAGHFVFASFYFGGVLYWIPRVLVEFGKLDWATSGLIYGLLVLLLDLFLLPFSILTHALARRTRYGALWCAPGFWILTELLRNYYTVNGFPWALLGHTQFPYRWIVQVADLSGVYLVSFLVVFGNVAILALFCYRNRGIPILFGLLFIGANAYGLYRCQFWKSPANASLKVALVQPNISLFASLDHYAEKYYEVLPKYYRQAVDEKVDWVIFPEAPNPYVYQEDFYFQTFWKRQVRQARVPLLFNSTSVGKSRPKRYFNSSYLLTEEEATSYRYDKMHLVPFGEYVPFADLLDFAGPLVKEVGGFSPGSKFTLGQVSGAQFASLICFEGIFPELARGFVLSGAQILINITNDTWYGTTAAPLQHLQIGAFRAIEQRRSLLRCANSGYSAHIDSTGAILQQMDLFQEGLLLTEVKTSSYRSIYSRVGEWINISAVVFVLLIFLTLVVRRRGGSG